jgi:hypothetical protein
VFGFAEIADELAAAPASPSPRDGPSGTGARRSRDHGRRVWRRSQAGEQVEREGGDGQQFDRTNVGKR